MASLSEHNTPLTSPHGPSQPLKGLKKVLSTRHRRSSEPHNELRTGSIDSLGLDKSPSRHSVHSDASHEGSSKSGSSGIRKLVPGHSKRQRRRKRDEELKAAIEEIERGRGTEAATIPPPAASQSTTSLVNDDKSSLLTDDGEYDVAPPLVSRDSHAAYLTTTSPLISTSTVNEPESIDQKLHPGITSPSTIEMPTIVEPDAPEGPSPYSGPVAESTPELTSAGLVDRADTLKIEPLESSSRRGSISKLRGISPARKFRDVFSRHGKSPRTSPERHIVDISSSPHNSPVSAGVNAGFSFSDTDLSRSPLRNSTPMTKSEAPAEALPDRAASTTALPILEGRDRPQTPPTVINNAPITTVTPPTPTMDQRASMDDGSSTTTVEPAKENPNITVSPSGNMISHRRVRSAGSVAHHPSKLSNSITAPLTPTLEEPKAIPDKPQGNRNFTPGGSFFSSWVSAAQNAATSITNLTNQNRARSGTASSVDSKEKPMEDTIKEEPEIPEVKPPKKQLAVETLGAGDLDFSHLGLDSSEERVGSKLRPGLEELRQNSSVQRDEAAARVEDMLAKRAVSAAYEKGIGTTPVAEIPDPLNSSTSRIGLANGDHSPPNGSIFESEVGSIKRKDSVRSRMKRRSRGSSGATGHSAIGALIGGSAAALANPATGPKLSGFAMAPKQRNRAFHQQFRSVPEDDYLIEDYSCALQREILLAGRIYISEGHICFSSNILGWVTTLVISFEEVVSIEKEMTAMIIPNAIAIQTLHARHTFRSLLSREATYDLLIGIWKVSHPASFMKSVNGKQLAAEESVRDAAGNPEEAAKVEEESEDSSDDEDDKEEDDDAASLGGSSVSGAGSEFLDAKSVARKPSGLNPALGATAPVATTTDAVVPTPPPAVGGEAAVDFPGPTTHGPTDCTDSSTHFDYVCKDEVISAPLGKVYSLLFGAQSGSFVRKYLVDECKAIDLAMEDDKKGLTSDSKSRQYSYIKPLGGSIGPKQTKTITTETLDFLDLEKSVSVSCATQTPDVPSGNSFVTKTRYCLSWAPGNATRFQMNMTIEWSAKSWLKAPIERGAKDGQGQYGEGLVKMLKSTVGRGRAATASSKLSKPKNKKRRASKRDKSEAAEEKKVEPNWGILEPVRGVLGPVMDVVKPALSMQVAVTVLAMMVLWLWFRTPSPATHLGLTGSHSTERVAAYEALWKREEAELWDWLEERVGVDSLTLKSPPKSGQSAENGAKGRAKERQKALRGKDVQARLKEEKMSQREMEDALRVTKERLDVLQEALELKKVKG